VLYVVVLIYALVANVRGLPTIHGVGSVVYRTSTISSVTTEQRESQQVLNHAVSILPVLPSAAQKYYSASTILRHSGILSLAELLVFWESSVL
jgi:hypothetical protein